MFLEAALLMITGAAIGLLASTWRIAALTSLTGAAVLWILVARSAYVSPMPVNEPEWWGGLAIGCTLAGIGVIIGGFARRRQSRSVAD